MPKRSCKYEGCEGCNHECPAIGKCKAYHRAARKVYEDTHVEERKADNKAYREANRDYYREYKKQWNKDNKEHIAQYDKENQLRIYAFATVLNHKHMGYQVEVTGEDVIAKALETPICKYCGCTINYNGDGHRMDGPSMDRVGNGIFITKDNIQIICKRCNANKGARSHTEFVDYAAMVLNRMDEE
jgi:5-methylcytosine-specific restriction endonuclease McrA